jgi:hypothetical protein
MTPFQSKNINTTSHIFLGTAWKFRNCQVEMVSDGFACDCQKKPRFKCNHIKSVELSILGVNCKEYMI